MFILQLLQPTFDHVNNCSSDVRHPAFAFSQPPLIFTDATSFCGLKR